VHNNAKFSHGARENMHTCWTEKMSVHASHISMGGSKYNGDVEDLKQIILPGLN